MRFVPAAFLALLWAPLAAQTTAQLRVDASDASRRLYHVQMTVPVQAGPVTLLYPKWIPGEHGPTGPIADLVGLQVRAGGQLIPWKRDSVNMFAFRVEVPAGVASLDVTYQFVAAPESGQFTSGASTTSELAVLNWNQVLLYPEGPEGKRMQVQATLKVPANWRYGTALPIAGESGNEIRFEPASVETLVDSPVSAGAHYRTIDLGTANGARHYLNIAADSDRALEVPPETVEKYRNLVKEANALFGARHYRTYHFLYTLSDHVAHFGLEHHESSDDRYLERTLIDPGPLKAYAYLLPHEFVHSWNGKYRRPAGLVPAGEGGYDQPMRGDLLWVYEGLTNYLGEVLTPRSGLWTDEDYRDSLAETAAELDTKFGRTWRPLEDTAIAAQILYSAGSDYSSLRRSTDFYPEGTLIWLEADVTIRRLSNGAKSLDDFCRSFYGGQNGPPDLKTYNFDDVVAALNAVQPYDWAKFLDDRLRSTNLHAPLGGIEQSGWKLTYTNVRSDLWKAEEEDHKLVDMSYSVGIKVNDEGTITDVLYGGPAQKAGIAPAVKLIAVNGRAYTPTLLRETVASTAGAARTIEFLTRNGEYFETKRVEYQGGERYPHLVRDPGTPDLLSRIIRPRAR